MERTFKSHELKILPRWYNDILDRKKTFVLCKYKDYKVGDVLLIREHDRGRYTGRVMQKEICYIYVGDGTHGLSCGYCILGVKNGKRVRLYNEPKCRDCKLFDMREESKTTVGYPCMMEKNWRSVTARLRQPSTRACKAFERKDHE